MARVKQSITIVRKCIDNMTHREEYYTIVGMLRMAVLLDKMTIEERDKLEIELDEKYWTLEY